MCFSLVCGCCPAFFSAKAATVAPNVILNNTVGAGSSTGGWTLDATITGTSNSAVLYQEMDLTGVNSLDITFDASAVGPSQGWATFGWWLSSSSQWSTYGGNINATNVFDPHYSNSSYYTYKATGNNVMNVNFDVSAISGVYYLCFGGYINSGGSYTISLTQAVVTDDTADIPEIPDYSGGVSGSTNSIVTIQQGFVDQGVHIDTVVSQLGAEIINDEIFTYPVGHPLEGEMYEKISMRMGVLVSCTISNANGQYAWLNDSYIGFQPSFSTSVPGLAEAASSYSLSDVYYSSPGFLVSSAQNGVIAFRFEDDTYYMGRLYLKPYATVSAAGILYFTCEVIAPYMNSATSIHLSESLSSAAMFGGNTLTGVNGVTGLLNNVPSSPSDTGGQVQIQGAVNNVQSAVNSMQQQQMQNYNDFINPSPSTGNDMVEGGISSVNEKLGIFTAVEGILQNTLGLFNEENIGGTKLVFPAFGMNIQGEHHQFWEDTEYDLSNLEEPFGALLSAVRLGTALVVYGALLMYLQKVFAEIIGGSSE